MANQRFRSFQDFGRAFKGQAAQTVMREEMAIEKGLLGAAELLQKKAKSKFGHYQDGWAQLTPATQADRVRKGYTANDPLLRSGELRDSIKITIKGRKAIVGSDMDIMLWQERGTEMNGKQHIPPRPVLQITGHKHGREAAKIFGKIFVEQLIKGK